VKKVPISAIILLTTLCSTAPTATANSAPEFRKIPEEPNFVIVMTDDQRWDTLWAMPWVNQELRPLSLDFRHAYVTTPECCPVRASLLAGGYYAHNTGVLTNGGANGGAPSFDDSRTLPLKLFRAGYKTALIGKYMNGYSDIAPRIPPGWTRFVGTVRSGNWSESTVAIGSSGASARMGELVDPTGHLVQFEFDEALRFLQGVGDEPFFLLVTPEAPHEPATPQPQDARRHERYIYRERAWGEEDVSDKPIYVRRRARRFEKNRAKSDEFHRDQLRTLRTVDRGVQALHEHLADTGKLRSTVFVFTSDNGFMWGEHRLEGKNLPYEESIRVPMLVSLAGAATGEADQLVAMNLDLGATVADLAGLYSNAKALARHTDGLSLRPLLKGRNPDEDSWRGDLLIQSFARDFAALLTREEIGGVKRRARAGWTWKYVVHDKGTPVEAYRSDIDRYETDSLDADPEFLATYREPLAARLHQLMGLNMITDKLPAGRLRAPYRKTIVAVGATTPYTWKVVDGRLPRGMRIHRRRGTLLGKPKVAGEFQFSIRVEASSPARYLNRPQSFTREFRLKVRE
jgi:arylsulfatase A-like enzyme